MTCPRRPHGPRIVLAIVACLVAGGLGGARGDVPPSEQEVKAAFLYHFTRFVEWPASNGPMDGRFVVAVLGTDQFSEIAERTLAGKSSRDLTFAVRRVRRPGEAEEAKIVFVGASEAGRVDEILRAVPGTGVLTVGDPEEFAEHGGMIGFRTVDNRVRFDINLEAANRSGLKISSEVLKLARVVRGKAP